MPATTIHVREHGVALSITTAPVPLYGDGVLPLAADLRCDVPLLRISHLEQDTV